MVIRSEAARTADFEQCHGGTGVVRCTELLADYKRTAPGFAFVHDDILPVGASIGQHEHHGNEEIYCILEGSGTMFVDGQPQPIGPGDICVTRSGHGHGLTNSGPVPMRFLVLCAITGPDA